MKLGEGRFGPTAAEGTVSVCLMLVPGSCCAWGGDAEAAAPWSCFDRFVLRPNRCWDVSSKENTLCSLQRPLFAWHRYAGREPEAPLVAAAP